MIKQYQFKRIEKYLKKDFEIGHDILDAFHSLFSAAIIFSPFVFGPQFISLFSLLEVNNNLFELGHKVCDYISSKVEPNYLDRLEQLEASYALICYTAYFDALEKELPKKYVKQLNRFYTEKQKSIEESNESDTKEDGILTHPEICRDVYYADHITSFPQIQKHLKNDYTDISKKLINDIDSSGAFKGKISDFGKIQTIILSLPEKAINNYTAQYIDLSKKFDDFAIYAELQNFIGVEVSIKQNTDAIGSLLNKTDQIDVGFQHLNEIINAIPAQILEIQAKEIVEDLTSKYHAMIEETIIDDKEIKSDHESISVKFPKIQDAFIPQDYKCLQYNQGNNHLENESEWEKVTRKSDLNRFIIKYLYSPDSIDYPLIILGHPGSGKSLLTKVLSAQLMSTSFTVIRIPLREVNAELELDALIEEQIKKMTNRPLSTQGYGGFAQQFKEKPLTVILDGYDELLQAKGKLFSGFIQKTQKFQQDQKSMKRPVRIIITSRITLIDKAYIPERSTILRLMEFDEIQRKTWIKIWNQINADYFIETKTKPFSLPDSAAKGKNKIMELAAQPLLLLMLAIYDSESNELAQIGNIKRTELYDNLLRRFVRRERNRYVTDFSILESKKQERIIEDEMNRLGVAAIGMYNRYDVVIQSSQLKNDIALFDANRDSWHLDKNSLQESDSVLGSFFFVHQSTAKTNEAHSDKSESAYEFLHNTFGEFLAADFILRNTINTVKNVYIDRKYKHGIVNLDTYDHRWYYCLMFVPLYSRPVIIEMLREHFPIALDHALSIMEPPIPLTQEVFLENLVFLVEHQLEMILNSRNIPQVMLENAFSDRDIPLIGYLSIYSLNLIIIVSALHAKGFTFDEVKYSNHESKEKDSGPWHKLASLWKIWFSFDDLTGLSVILNAKRINDTKINIKCNRKFEATHYEHPIDALLCVSSTLADHLITGLSGIQSEHFSKITHMDEVKILDMLMHEDTELYFSYLIKLIRNEINGASALSHRYLQIDYDSVNRFLISIINDKRFIYAQTNIVLDYFELIESCLLRNIIFISTKRKIAKNISQILDKFRHTFKRERTPEIMSGIRVLMLLTVNTASGLADSDSDEYFSGVLIDDLDKDFIKKKNYQNCFIHSLSSNRSYYYELDMHHSFYQKKLIDNIEKSISLSPSEKSKILQIYLEPRSVDIYLKTNPELITYTMLVFIISTDRITIRNSEFFIDFIRKCIAFLKEYGVRLFSYEALINIIKIADILHIDEIDIMINDFLDNNLFRKSRHSFTLLVYSQPKIANTLLHIIPDFFQEHSFVLYGSIYQWNNYPTEASNKLLDYISCLRSIDAILGSISNIEMSDFISYIKKSLRRYDLPIDLFKLSYKQIDDLIWFMQHHANKAQAQNFIDRLSEHKKALIEPKSSLHMKMSMGEFLLD